MASDGKVLQAPQTSEPIPDSLVSRRVADEPLHGHELVIRRRNGSNVLTPLSQCRAIRVSRAEGLDWQ
jgi:hypothetical protein